MAENSYDLIVLGGGPGGYVAAIRAAQLGMKTALVERDQLGGICLNWGCIPTKALLRSAEISHILHHLDEYGFSAKEVDYDAAKVVARSRAVAKQLSNGVAYLLKKNKISVFDGQGRLAGDGRLAVTKDDAQVVDLAAPHIVLATGARARSLPGLEPDGERVWTYKEAMVPAAVPKSLLVVGSGAIGIEFASFYRDMGSDVTVVELLDRVLPVEDEEISAFARKSFEKQGIKIHTGATVKTLERSAGQVAAQIQAGGKMSEILVEKIILAVGIVGNVEDIGLEGTAVEVERGHVVVDEWLRTGEPGIYAVGDLVGPPWLAHKASHEGVICVEHIAGVNDVHPLDTRNIPACTYCRPQVASVGLTETAARAAGYEVKVGHFPFIGNGKAIALGEPEGLVKTVFDSQTGELLGAHMVGAEVTELIQGYAIAKTLETTEAELIRTIFPHPTLSETMHEAVLDAYGRAIHF
ncbi:MAG TPA: dihydrolipoyl dehydrogenase [Stellaceae bacterium]|nr:dihydrolipoyl dehydrogenase [Stellaceae bacterium]